jgi:hypothetical protein
LWILLLSFCSHYYWFATELTCQLGYGTGVVRDPGLDPACSK